MLDADAFVALSDADGTFKPNAVIDQLRALTGHIPDFSVQPRLVVSSFAEVAGDLVADARHLEHPVLDALAGNATAKWAIEEGYGAVQPIDPDRREPSTDVLLLDADSEQENVVAQIAAGNSLVVKTMPGTGGTQTIVNALGALVGQNKRVLVVSPRRASLRGISRALRRHRARRRHGHAAQPAPRHRARHRPQREGAAAAARRGRRGARAPAQRAARLPRRPSAAPDDVLGVSVFDCVTELSRLALLPHPPSTTARLDRATVERLATDRASVAATMLEAAQLGEFRYGPGDSPWYGARFANGDEATRAHDIAKRLHGETLPRLLVRGAAADRLDPHAAVRDRSPSSASTCGCSPTSATRSTGSCPAVFDRSLSELIVADGPAPRQPRDVAGEPSPPEEARAASTCVPACTSAICTRRSAAIQQQRILWQRFVAAGVTPEVPTGISEVHVAWQQVAHDLAALDGAARAHDARDSSSRTCRCTGSASCSPVSPPTPTCCRTCRSAAASSARLRAARSSTT